MRPSPEFGTAFREGLLVPSISSLSAASLVCMALAAWAVTSLGPRWLQPDRIRWFAASERDDEAFVAAQIVTLPDTPRDLPHIVLLGASSMREGITSAEDVARRMRAATGEPVRVLELMSDNQSPEQSGGLAGLVPEDVPAVVVLGVTAYGLSRGYGEALAHKAHFGVPLPDLDAELVAQGFDVPRNTGVPLLDDRAFYLARLPYLPGNVVTGGTTWSRHRYRGLRSIAVDEFDRYETIQVAFEDLTTALYDDGAARIEVVGRVIDRIRARGHRVVVVPGPRARGWPEFPAEAETLVAYDLVLSGLEEETGVEVWRLQEDIELPRSDFMDVLHLNQAAATERFTQALVDRLVPVVRTLR